MTNIGDKSLYYVRTGRFEVVFPLSPGYLFLKVLKNVPGDDGLNPSARALL